MMWGLITFCVGMLACFVCAWHWAKNEVERIEYVKKELKRFSDLEEENKRLRAELARFEGR